jgi:hypothetical protein
MNDRGGVLDVAAAMPIDQLPAQYREPMRRYLLDGAQPECELFELLEGALASAMHHAERQAHARISDVMRAARWIEEHLPACAHGNRDQVGLWMVYVRRARGRAMLASMAEAAP